MEKENQLREELPRISPGEVAFDIDGVFADTFRLFVERAKCDFGYGFRYQDITEYDFATVIHIDERASDAIVFDQPWNRKPHPFPVVKTWNDIAALISW